MRVRDIREHSTEAMGSGLEAPSFTMIGQSLLAGV
jgi:hypothetical protein